jgi:hypothetical protein
MIETRLGEFEEVLLLLVGILGDENAYAFRIAEEFESQTGRSSVDWRHALHPRSPRRQRLFEI